MKDTKLDLVWGAEAIARELSVPDHRINLRLYEKGVLPFVRKVGGMLVAERGEMRKHFTAPGPNKAA